MAIRILRDSHFLLGFPCKDLDDAEGGRWVIWAYTIVQVSPSQTNKTHVKVIVMLQYFNHLEKCKWINERQIRICDGPISETACPLKRRTRVHSSFPYSECSYRLKIDNITPVLTPHDTASHSCCSTSSAWLMNQGPYHAVCYANQEGLACQLLAHMSVIHLDSR